MFVCKCGSSVDGTTESPWFNLEATAAPEAEIVGYVKTRIPACAYLTSTPTVMGNLRFTYFTYWKNLRFAGEQA